MVWLWLALIAAALPAVSAAPAGRQTTEDAASAVFRTESNLALVRFQVIAKRNAHVEDLRADEIELREDGVPQRIKVFEGGKFYPRATKTDVYLFFDCSGSIRREKLLNPHVFSSSLLDEFPNVRIAMWGFSGTPVTRYVTLAGPHPDPRAARPVAAPTNIYPVLLRLGRFADPTRDSGQLAEAMDGLTRMRPGLTPLYGALIGLIGMLPSDSDSVRMIVMISDGEPMNDSAKPEAAVRAARDAGVSVFPTLIRTEVRAGPSPSVVQGQPSIFLGLGKATGGTEFSFEGTAPKDLLDRVLKLVADQIRYDYVVGYSPDAAARSGTHKIQIVLKDASRGRVAGGTRDVTR